MKNENVLLILSIVMVIVICCLVWIAAKAYYSKMHIKESLDCSGGTLDYSYRVAPTIENGEVLIGPGAHFSKTSKVILSITRGNTIEYKDGSLMQHGPIINIGDNYSIGLPIGT